MPLKHATETVLIALLALLIVATGIAVSILPPIPTGFIPWAIVAGITVLYPAVLYPTLKRNRADYLFRALHFAPAAIAMSWIVLEAAVLKEPRLGVVERGFLWGWSSVSVVTALVLLGAFCLHVIRQRARRLGILLLLLVPVVASGYASERYTHWDTRLAAALRPQWERLVAVQPDPDPSLSSSSRGEKNLTTSSIAAEEAWRSKMRSVERGEVHSKSSSMVIVDAPLLGVESSNALISQTGMAAMKKKRANLPHSGPHLSLLIVLALAGASVMAQRKQHLA